MTFNGLYMFLKTLFLFFPVLGMAQVGISSTSIDVTLDSGTSTTRTIQLTNHDVDAAQVIIYGEHAEVSTQKRVTHWNPHYTGMDCNIPLDYLAHDERTDAFYTTQDGALHRLLPGRDEWEFVTELPSVVFYRGNAIIADGKYIIFSDPATLIYDIDDNSWNTTSGVSGALVYDGDLIYIISGSTYSPEVTFDPETHTFGEIPGYGERSARVAYGDGYLYSYSFRGDDLYRYDIGAESWEILTQLPTDSSHFGLAFHQNRLYLSDAYYYLWNYNLLNGEWTRMSYTSTSTSFIISHGNSLRIGWPKDGFCWGDYKLWPDWLLFDREPITVPGGSSVEVTVTLDAEGINQGDYAGRLRFFDDALVELDNVEVALHVNGAALWEIDTASLDFGTVTQADSVNRFVTISNTGTAPLTVNISANEASFSHDSNLIEVQPGRTESLMVTFTPDTPGTFTGQLSLQSSLGSHVIALQGESVLGATLDWTPTPIDVMLEQNTASTHSYILTNTGTETLEVSLDDANNPAMSSAGDLLPSEQVNFLANSPKRLMALAADPHTGSIYGLRYRSLELYRYDPQGNRWTLVSPDQPDLVRGEGQLAAYRFHNFVDGIYLDGKLFFPERSYRYIYCYDLESHAWERIEGAHASPTATDGTYIYSKGSQSLWRYDPYACTVRTFEAPSTEGASSIAYHDGFLYVFDDAFRRYEIATNTWVTLDNTTIDTVGKFQVLDDTLLAVSMNAELDYLNRYHIPSDTWTTTPLNANLLLESPGAAVLNGRFYFTLGQQGERFCVFQGLSWLEAYPHCFSLEPGF